MTWTSRCQPAGRATPTRPNPEGGIEVIVDAADDADSIIGAVAGRAVTAVVCTHGQNDHSNVATDLGMALYAPARLHPGDGMPWRDVEQDGPFLALD